MEREHDLDYIEEQIKRLQKMKDQHIKSKKESELNANTEALLNQIHNITKSNSIRERLCKDTKTVPIIDGFYSSTAKYLIVERAFRHVNHGYLSLVICKSTRDVDLISSELTMTNLKQESGNYIRYNAECYKGTRFYSLMKCVCEVLTDKWKSGECVPFKKPCQFNAQRSANRRGYGNEYHGDTLMHDGTNYGETTTFAIIGIIFE